MSEKTIQLKVPADVAEEYPEFVSHGNREAELVPGSIVETEDRRFADFLIANYGLTEIEKAADAQPDEDVVVDPAKIDGDEYPPDFPARDVLIGLNVAYATAARLDADQLQLYKGIGPKTADEIVKFVGNGGNE